jgi:hypothetical protein
MKPRSPCTRKPLWITAVVLLLFLGCQPVLSVQTDVMNYSAGVYFRIMGPVVSGTTQNATVIRMVTNIPCNPLTWYANDSWFSEHGTYDHIAPDQPAGTIHTIPLTWLDPATRYHYRVTGCGMSGEDRTFSTFSESGSCSFIVYGDTREQAPYFTQIERHKIVADRIAGEPNISFVINTGDLVNNPADTDEWDRFFTAGKKVFDTTTYAVVPGNHDSNQSQVIDLYGTDGVYSFDCGGAHIAVLDSTDNSRISLAEQARWLRSDLGSTEKWKIVVLHHPLFTSEDSHFGGFENLQKIFGPVFVEENVSVVFNGHVHAYERVEKGGIMYITEGRGGAPAYPLRGTKLEGSAMSRENSLGYTRITTGPGSEYLKIDAIQVADLSPDLRTIATIYSPNVSVDHVDLIKPGLVKAIRTIREKTGRQLPGLFCCLDDSGRFAESQISECVINYLLPG